MPRRLQEPHDNAELTDGERSLLLEAMSATQHAYAPYSGFAVGVAVQLKDGRVLTSANMENASLGLTVCAEVGALAAANSSGGLDQIRRIAVVGKRFFPTLADGGVVTPCGRCRQLIAEAAALTGRDIDVICANADLSRVLRATSKELLPNAFEAEALGLKQRWSEMRRRLKPE